MSELHLNTHEARALGVLIEKELTTPDQYPLSLNALVAGCNQKSNRDPVTDFTPAELVVTLQGLVAKHMAGRSSGGRVEHFRHNATTHLQLSRGESAVLAELLLRGPQQPGELRTRVKRMAPVESQDELLGILQELATKELVKNIGRSPGARAQRWAQVLSPPEPVHRPVHRPDHEPVPEAAQGNIHSAVAPERTTMPAPAPGPVGMEGRVQALEERVARLEALLADLGG